VKQLASLVLRLALATLAVVAGTAVAPGIAVAQPAAALGRPLPDGTLSKGTVSVRVVAGSPSSPVVGADVTMLVNGEPRVARTDAAGRATFGNLPVGAMVQAKIVDDNKKEITSETFPVPEEGGARLMLSTKPFSGTGGMPAAGGMGGAMPEARQMSGQPRPDGGLPAGTFVVRVTYNNLALKDGESVDSEPPVGIPVYLVGYGADDSIKVTTLPTDAKGNATFTDLDVTGATSYFALAALPRQLGRDRLISVPTVLDPQGGARVVLSGDKRTATTPPIDDYGKLIPSDGSMVPANRVRVSIDGVGEPGTEVTLFDAATMKPVGVTKTQRGAPDPTQVRGSANYNPRPDLPPGVLEIEIKGGMGAASDPLASIEVRLVGADDDAPIANGIATTGIDGKAKITIKPDPAVKAVLIINGKQMVSSGMELSTAGGKLDVTAQWPAQGKPEAVFEVADNLGPVFYAQTVMSQQLFRSLPFQTVPGVGSSANVYVYPRTLFSFDTHSFVEDQLLAVQGTFEVTNYSWAPYKPAGPDGLLIKLPKHHKGAIIAAVDQSDVAVAQGEGFRILRPIPPGGRKFRAGYSMPIEHGEVDWKFDLPLGSWQSEMKIRQTPGMTVKLPQGVQGETQTASSGEPWFVITGITIDRGQAMALTISGFPTEAAWRIWAPRIIGILVLVMILGGVALAFGRTSAEATSVADREARRAKLLDELVDLERRGVSSSKERHRKEQLIDELERLWGA